MEGSSIQHEDISSTSSIVDSRPYRSRLVDILSGENNLIFQMQKKQIQNYEEEMKRKDKEIEQMKVLLNDSITNRDSLLNDNTSLKITIEQLQQRNKPIENELIKLKSQVQTQANHIDWQKTEIDNRLKDISALRNELISVKTDSTIKINGLLREKEDILIERNMISTTKEALENQIQDLLSEVKQLKSTCIQQQAEKERDHEFHQYQIQQHQHTQTMLQDKVNDFAANIQQLKETMHKLVQDHESEMDVLIEKAEKVSSEAEQFVEEQKNQSREVVHHLRTENEELKKQLEHARLNPFGFLGFEHLSSTAQDEELLRKGFTLSSLCNKYMEEAGFRRSSEAQAENLRNILKALHEEVEAKATLFEKQKEQITKLLEVNESLSRSLLASDTQKGRLEKDVAEKQQMCLKLTDEINVLKQDCKEFKIQLQNLLFPHSVNTGRSLMDDYAASTSLSSSSQVLTPSKGLIVFNNTEELISRNEDLRMLVHELKKENTRLIVLVEEMNDSDKQKSLHEVTKELEKLKEFRAQQEELFNAVINQRDTYRSLLEKSNLSNSNNNSSIALLNQTDTSNADRSMEMNSPANNNKSSKKIAQLEEEIQETREQYDTLTKEYESFRNEVNIRTSKYLETIERTRKELEIVKSKSEGYHTELIHEKKKNEIISEERTKLDIERRELQSILKEQSVRVIKLEGDISSLNATISDSKSHIELLKSQESLTKTELSLLKSDIEHSKSRINELSSQLETERKMNKTLKDIDNSQLKELQLKISTLIADKNAVEKEKKDLENSLLNHRIEYSKENQRWKEENDRAKNVIDTLKNNISLLHEKISQLESEKAKLGEKEKVLQERIKLASEINEEIRALQEQNYFGGRSSNSGQILDKNRIEELEAETNNFRVLLQEKSNDLESIQAAVAAAEGKAQENMERLKQAKEGFEIEKSNLMSQLKSVQEEVEKLRLNTPADFEVIKKRLATLEQLSKDDEITKKKLNEQLESLTSSVSAKDAQLKDIESKYEHETSEHVKTQTLLANLRESYAGSEQAQQQLSNEINQLNQIIKVEESKAKALKSEFDNLKKLNELLDDENRSLAERIISISEEFQRGMAFNSATSLQAESEKDKEIAKLKQNNSSLEELLLMIRNQKNVLAIEKTDLEREIIKLKEEIKKKEFELASLNKSNTSISENTSDVQSISDHNKQLETQQENAKLTKENNSLREDLERMKENLNKSATQMNKLKEEINKLRASEEGLSTSKDKMHSEKIALETELSNLKTSFVQLKKDMGEKVDVEKYNKVVQEVEQLKAQNMKLEQVVKAKESELEQTSNKLNQRIKALENDIQATNSENAKKLESLNKELEAKQSELQEIQTQFKAKDEKISELESQKFESIDSVEDASTVVDYGEDSVSEADSELLKNPRNYWTDDEVKILREAVALVGEKDWRAVSYILKKNGFNRTNNQCGKKWHSLNKSGSESARPNKRQRALSTSPLAGEDISEKIPDKIGQDNDNTASNPVEKPSTSTSTTGISSPTISAMSSTEKSVNEKILERMKKFGQVPPEQQRNEDIARVRDNTKRSGSTSRTSPIADGEENENNDGDESQSSKKRQRNRSTSRSRSQAPE